MKGNAPPCWPRRHSVHISVPANNVFENLRVSALRYPDKTAIEFYGTRISYQDLLRRVCGLAGHLRETLGLGRGDRVLLDMQNSPAFMIAYYAILCADAIVVPVNPMNVTEELAWCVSDSGAKAAIVAQELYPRIEPLLDKGSLGHVIVATYADDIASDNPLPLPPEFAAPRLDFDRPDVSALTAACTHRPWPAAGESAAEDIAVIVYTSGTTGQPKGCALSHRALNAETVSLGTWNHWAADKIALATAPFFHVTGMGAGLNLPLYYGAEVVLLPRWDRQVAATLIQRNRVTHWTNIPTMIVDLLALPDIDRYDLSSIEYIGGGGAAMPEAVAARLFEISGLRYQEGWGLSEVAGAIHLNPVGHEKRQCLGIPIFDVDSRILDVDSGQELGPNAPGEIVTRCPSLFSHYWNNDTATAAAFIELEGNRYFRTGDIGYRDEEGYFFLADRLKRMINASGYKVWPAEVESTLYRHPAIQEACVVGVHDPYRGETVKAFVVLKADAALAADELIAWSREQMSAYKIPRIVEFVDTLPKSGTGKIQWRLLQQKENVS